MNDLYKEACLIAKTLEKIYKPEKIILFGSAARGNFHKDSDIDLFILKNSTQKKAYRIRNVFKSLRSINRVHPLDPVVYTPDELNKRLALGDHFIKRVFSEGKVLYGQKH